MRGLKLGLIRITYDSDKICFSGARRLGSGVATVGRLWSDAGSNGSGRPFGALKPGSETGSVRRSLLETGSDDCCKLGCDVRSVGAELTASDDG